MDRWQTYPVQFTGGLITNQSPLQQGINMPGSAVTLRNFEPSIEGGYRRILGYEKWDDDLVSGSEGLVRGVFYYQGKAVAAVGSHLYWSGGNGWTQLTDNATFSSTGITLSGVNQVGFAEHSFDVDPILIIVDKDGNPLKFDGTTLSEITTGPSEMTGADHVLAHKNHLFVSSNATLVFSAPFSDSDFTPASGAGTIVFDNEITALATFREQLVVFTKRSIFIIAGSSIADFKVEPVTRDIGCVHPNTVQEIGGDIMFLAPDGLRLLSATERIGDFGLGVVSKVIQPEFIEFTKTASSYTGVVIRNKSQYRLLGYNPSVKQDAARGIIATQFAQQGGEGMAFAETRGINAYCTFSKFTDTEEVVLFANNDGYVYRMEKGYSFDGNDIVATFSTPHLPITDPAVRKTLFKASLYIDPQGSFRVNLTPRYDFAAQGSVQPGSVELSNITSTVTYYGIGTYGTSQFGNNLKYVFDTNLTGSGKSVQFQFTSESTDPPFSLDSLVIQYGQYGRR